MENKKFDDMLGRIQNDLFDLGADLATPESEPRRQGDLRITSQQVKRIEEEIDDMNAKLEPLNSFILPGGVPVAAHIHLARAQARHTEREITKLAAQETVGEPATQYINRLSDHLFVMARYINNIDDSDVLWEPGQNA
jgi:cob(I)alamin adenosyltransferase